MAIAQAYYLEQAADFTTPLPNNSTNGMISFWAKMSASSVLSPGFPSAYILLYDADGFGGQSYIDPFDGHTQPCFIIMFLGGDATTIYASFQFYGFTGGGGNATDGESNVLTTDPTAWHHYFCAWDSVGGNFWLYIDGVDQLDPGASTIMPANLDAVYYFNGAYTRRFKVGYGADACIRDFYLNTSVGDNSYVSAFISGGAPVDLGPTGANPTGVSPDVYLPLLVAAPEINASGNGDMSIVYDPSVSVPTNCSTDP